MREKPNAEYRPGVQRPAPAPTPGPPTYEITSISETEYVVSAHEFVADPSIPDRCGRIAQTVNGQMEKCLVPQSNNIHNGESLLVELEKPGGKILGITNARMPVHQFIPLMGNCRFKSSAGTCGMPVESLRHEVILQPAPPTPGHAGHGQIDAPPTPTSMSNGANMHTHWVLRETKPKVIVRKCTSPTCRVMEFEGTTNMCCPGCHLVCEQV